MPDRKVRPINRQIFPSEGAIEERSCENQFPLTSAVKMINKRQKWTLVLKHLLILKKPLFVCLRLIYLLL